MIRYSLLVANIIILAGVAGFIMLSSRDDSRVNAIASTLGQNTANPIDQLTSYDIAANVARIVDLPEQTAINNQAQSAQVAVAVSSSNAGIVSKPQIVATALKSRRDIQTYVAAPGDTVSSIANRFGVTSDSIRWSNDLVSDAIKAGTKLVIPPVNGIVYTVKAGDTVQSLAKKYKANADQIIAYNDAEINGLTVGEQIIIPNGQIIQRSSSYFSIGGAFNAHYGGNGYDYGYCTWWVAARRIQVGKRLPSNLGNASTWYYRASRFGMSVGRTPAKYAAAVTSTRGEGHVVFVESVNSDGSVTVSEMNHMGWKVEDTRTFSAAQAAGFSYIY